MHIKAGICSVLLLASLVRLVCIDLWSQRGRWPRAAVWRVTEYTPH